MKEETKTTVKWAREVRRLFLFCLGWCTMLIRVMLRKRLRGDNDISRKRYANLIMYFVRSDLGMSVFSPHSSFYIRRYLPAIPANGVRVLEG
jgi:hypothetical protein